MPSTFIKNKVRLSLQVGGASLPVQSASATFSLNAVPQAVIGLGVGRSLRDGSISPTHRANYGPGWVPAELKIKVDGAWDERGGNAWTDAGEQTIFEGWAVSRAWSRSTQSISNIVHLVHWLSDLSFASTLSEQSHPQNPFDLSFNSVYFNASATGGSSQSSFTALTMDTASESAIQQDIWAEAILKLFERLSEEDLLVLGDQTSCGGLGGSNQLAAAALAKLRSSLSLPYYVPLNLNLDAAAAGVAKGIRQYMAGRSIEQFWHSTLWDVLVGEFGPKLFLQVVPMVKHALVTPLAPSLRRTFKTIRANSTDYLAPSLFQQRPLRATGVYTTVAAETGFAPAAPQRPAIGGCWMPDPDRTGMVRYFPAPEWLSSVPLLSMNPASSLLANRIATATTPALADLDSAGPDTGAVRDSLADLATRIAKHYYGMEIFQGRSLVYSGKLRFDIAPGSMVRISGLSPDPGANASDDMIGLVNRVTYQLSSEGQDSCSTSFGLSHVRSASENDNSDLSLDAPAVYTQGYTGAPLVPEFDFP